MTYLDNGATSFEKPPAVERAVLRAMETCANPGRGGYRASMNAAQVVLACRERAAEMFSCQPEQVVFTQNCTQGLNMAIRTLVNPGDRVVISGFEHNAVTRPLHYLCADVTVAGRKLFDWEDTLSHFEDAVKQHPAAAVFTHMSNVFGYILPVEQMAEICRRNGVPFVVDAAQSAGSLPVDLEKWGADFIAMPGHKGLLGPQGTGMLLCANLPKPLMQGGTGSLSALQEMPDFLPDRGEAGTLNVPGIAGLGEGIAYLQKTGIRRIAQREQREAKRCIKGLEKLKIRVFSGEHQGGTLSFITDTDCEEMAQRLETYGIAVRAGLHCAPVAHESAGTLESGTIRVSYGFRASPEQTANLLFALAKESGQL